MYYVGFQIPHGKELFGGKGQPTVKYRDALSSVLQKWLIEILVDSGGPKKQCIRWRSSPRNRILDGVQMPSCLGAILRGKDGPL